MGNSGKAVPVLLDFFIDGGGLHSKLGYTALAFTLVRIIWGFLTNDRARFTSFPLGFKSLLTYSKNLFAGHPKNYPGHNPIASWVYIIIWILVIALGFTGFLMGQNAYWGEAWLEDLHKLFSNSLLLLVLVHLAGIMIDSWKFKRRTWMGMINGQKG